MLLEHRDEESVLLRLENWRRDKEGRVFVLDLEELVGFLLMGNVNHKPEMAGKSTRRLASSLIWQEQSAWRESHGKSSPDSRKEF